MLSRLLLVRWWAGLLATMVLPSFLFDASSAWAEGSRSLYPSTYPAGGSRANLDIQPGSKYVGKVNRRTFLYVYAQAGEYILLGSRNRTATNQGVVNIYSPQDFGTPGDETVPGSPTFTCSETNTLTGPNYSGAGRGLIDARVKENVGPQSVDGTGKTTGYTPCAYQAPSTGVYGVVFAPAGTGSGPNAVIDPPAISNNSVSAWDVTVRSSNPASTTDLEGRLFTYAWAAFTGGNGRPVYSTHYYVTNDGYRYSQDLRGLDPNGYVLYANSLGFLDNGQPLYKDLRTMGIGTTTQFALIDPTLLSPGVTTQIAQYPIFFSDVSNNVEVERVLAALNIPLTPPSPTVSNLSFSGHLVGSITTVGAGGTFTFTTTNTITYQIVVSRNGADFDPMNVNNAVLTGIAGTGTHNVNWDGKDNSGVNFPAGGPYTFRVLGRNGEVHFPIIDAENNPGAGPTITRLNGTNFGDRTVYYDDRGYRTSSGNLVGNLNGTLCPTASPAAPTVPASLLGVDSSTNYRNWGSGSNANSDCASGAGWGDAKGLNLWTYFSTAPQSNTLSINPIVIDVATSVSAPSTATAGDTVQGTFSFANNGNSTANGVTYGLTLSPGLGPVTFSNLPVGTTASYNNATGVVTFGGTPLPVTLGAGQSIPYMTFSYTAPSTGPVVATTTIATTSNDTYPANNTATVSTGIGQTDVLTTVSVPATAAAGSTVSGTFTFGNNGAGAAAGVTYTATVDSGTCPQSFQFTSLPTNVIATCSGGTISFTGLPSSLAAGQSFNFDFTYTMPASGSIPINTSINTTSSDANLANNSASGSTMTSMVSMSGTVFADIDGSGVQNGSEVGINAGGLNAVVVDSTGKVLAVAPVDSNGSWTTNVPAGTNYSAYITAASPTVGSTVTPTATLPTGWSVSGENISGVVDGTPNGILTGIDASATVSGLNFGIQQSADLSLTKAVDKATPVNGDQITYTLTVANAGPAQATGVTVADTLPAGKVTFVSASAGCSHSGGVVTCGPASVTAGGDVQFQITVTVTDATGGLGNAAQITAADQPDPNSTPNNGTGNGEDDQVTLNTPQPVADLELTNVVNNATPAMGANVTFTVTLTNKGPDSATDVEVNALLPAGYTLVSATPSSGSYDPTTGDWTVGTLPATTGSNTETLTLVATVLATGSYDVTAQVVASDAFDPDSIPNNNNAVEDDQQTAAVQPVGPPSATDDAITVPFNTAGTLTNVLSNDTASNGATLDPATLDLDPSTAGIQTTYTVSGQGTFALVTANGIPTGAVTFTPATDFIGTVSIPYLVADDQGQIAQATLKATVLPPATVDVYTTVSAPAGAPLNGVVNAILTYGNQGTAVASGVSYSVTLPAGLSGVGCIGATCSYDSNTGIVTVIGLPASLNPGQTEQVVLSYTATATGTLAVQSTIGTTATDSSPGNNSASASTQVPAPAVTDVVALVDAPTTATAGSTVAVDVTFLNLGTAPATGVTYNLALLPGLTNVTCTGSGISCSYAGTTVTITGLPSSLDPAQTVGLILSYTAPAAADGPVNVTATVSAAEDPGAAGNNSASGSTAINASATVPDVISTIAPPASAAPGSTVIVPITYANLGPDAATVTAYGLTFSGTGTATNIEIRNNGVLCTYAGNVLSGCGLPGTLDPGQSIDLTLTYKLPANNGDTITVTSNIGASGETNTANNVATGTTVVVSASVPDVYTAVDVPATIPAGGTVNALLTFGNQGLAVADGVTYTVTLPPNLSGISCAGATCTYDSATGVLTLIGLPTSLSPGQTETVLLSYLAPTAGAAVLTVQSSIATTTPGETPTNNSASGSTTVQALAMADVTTWIHAPPSATGGGTVAVTAGFTNLGTANATAVTYALTLPAGATVSYNGVACTYSGGAVTGCGLPTTLAPGQIVELVAHYIAPATGPVDVTSTVGAGNDGDGTNNTAIDSTVISAATTADVYTTVAAPATAAAGSAVQASVTYGNLGPATATGMSYTLVLTGAPTGITVSYNGVVCGYNSGTGAVTGCGLPSSLVTGQTVHLTLNYTAPASGTVQVTSTVGTETTESNAANNSATASTTITATTTADLYTTIRSPATATAGNAVQISVTYGNLGSVTATGVSYQLALPPGLSGVRCDGPPVCNYNSRTGTVTVTGLPDTLDPGQTVNLTLSYIMPVSGSVIVTTNVTVANDSNPNNNTASAGAMGFVDVPTLSPTALLALILLMWGCLGQILRLRGTRG